jgi:hypothetical protein
MQNLHVSTWQPRGPVLKRLCGTVRALHCTALHCTALHCTALHCTALHCTALHCTALLYTALCGIVLHCSHLQPPWDPFLVQMQLLGPQGQTGRSPHQEDE